MRGHSRTLASLLALLVAGLTTEIGCHGTARRTISNSSVTTSGEPALSSDVGDSGTTVVEPAPPVTAAPAGSVGIVDRHPLFRKPRQYYDNTKSSNKAVKTAAAAVVGVPAGIIGELKQIVVGAPTPSTPTAY